MGKFGAFFAVLRYGTSLSDPAVWKQRQNLFNALVGLLGGLVVLLPALGVHVEVSDDVVVKVAGAVAAVVGLFVNPYLTTATTDKIGLQPRDADPARSERIDP